MAVPTHFYKVLVSTADETTFEMVAFLLPNRARTIRGTPADFVVPIDVIERLTGHDFFADVPDPVEQTLEAVPGDWPF